jgi:hypothetical protein
MWVKYFFLIFYKLTQFKSKNLKKLSKVKKKVIFSGKSHVLWRLGVFCDFDRPPPRLEFF